MNKLSLLAVAMFIAADAYGAGSCVVCPFGMRCDGGTAAPVDDAAAAKADRERMGIPAFPDGVYAKNGWYLQAVDPTHATQSKHIKIKAGTTFIVNGKVITFTADTNKSISVLAIGGNYDICINDELDTTSAAAGATTNSTGIKADWHNTACGTGWLKIGGFHAMPCASADTATLPAAHPYYNAKQGSIMPNSVWTLKHHPVSVQGGFVYDPAMGHWVMIYLATLGNSKSYYQDTLANNTIPISSTRYDPTSCRDQTGYCDGATYGLTVQANDTTNDTTTTHINTAKKLISLHNMRVATGMQYREMFDLLAAGGAKPLSDAQFSSAASGSIEGAAIGTRDYNTGCHTFSGRPNISNIGAFGMTGEYWQDIEHMAGTGSTLSQDGGKGGPPIPDYRVIAGGDYNGGTYAGSRYRHIYSLDARAPYFAARGMSPDAWR